MLVKLHDNSLEHYIHFDYYRGVLEKLYVFQLTDYDRVIVMDADGFPNNNLDHLFWLTMPEGTFIAGVESAKILQQVLAVFV